MATKIYRTCPNLRAAIKFSLVTQILIVILAGFVADGGGAAQIVFFAFVSFNAYLASILVFRPKTPTRLDLIMIRAGFLPTIVITSLVADYIWDIRGF